MKGLIRWGLIVSLAGGGFVSTSILRQSAAIAIPEAEAIKRLESIPTFAVTDGKGAPVLASVPDPKDKSKKIQVATFFMGQADAQNLVNNLKSNKPELGKTARVTPVSLKKAYEITKENQDKQDELVFQFIPTQEQVDFAKAILKQEGQEAENFNGVPMFFAIGGEEKGLLTIEQDENKVIPFYFRKQDLQGVIDQLKEQKNPLSGTTKIQVTSLDRVVGNIIKSEDATAKQILLIPARDALEFAVEKQKEQGGTPPAGAAPASAPPANPGTSEAPPEAK